MKIYHSVTELIGHTRYWSCPVMKQFTTCPPQF